MQLRSPAVHWECDAEEDEDGSVDVRRGTQRIPCDDEAKSTEREWGKLQR